jgi:aminoglycoside phosphotransferase (APT) family kinase protein
MVMEHMAGVPLLEKMRNPLALGGVLRGMAALQVRLHGLPVSGCPLPADHPLIDRRLAALREDIECYEADQARAPLKWLEMHADRLAGEEPAVTHNDYHPRNILVDDNGSLSLLDWSDAALGDRHCDLARTMAIFHMAPLLVTGVESLVLRALRPHILRTYRRAYESRLPVEVGRLRYWQAFHAAQGIAQVVIAQHPRSADAGVRQDIALPPRLLPELQRYFESHAVS